MSHYHVVVIKIVCWQVGCVPVMVGSNEWDETWNADDSTGTPGTAYMKSTGRSGGQKVEHRECNDGRSRQRYPHSFEIESRHRSESDFLRASESPFSRRLRVEIQERLAQGIHELSERGRRVIALYYVEELTMKEIAILLGITEGRVSQIHSAVLAKLRKRLGEDTISRNYDRVSRRPGHVTADLDRHS